MSGGHCVLCLAKNVNSFVTLGTTTNSVTPGYFLDKVSLDHNNYAI